MIKIGLRGLIEAFVVDRDVDHALPKLIARDCYRLGRAHCFRRDFRHAFTDMLRFLEAAVRNVFEFSAQRRLHAADSAVHKDSRASQQLFEAGAQVSRIVGRYLGVLRS